MLLDELLQLTRDAIKQDKNRIHKIFFMTNPPMVWILGKTGDTKKMGLIIEEKIFVYWKTSINLYVLKAA